MKKLLVVLPCLMMCLSGCYKAVEMKDKIINKRITKVIFSSYYFDLESFGEMKVDFDTYHKYKIGDTYTWTEYI